VKALPSEVGCSTSELDEERRRSPTHELTVDPHVGDIVLEHRWLVLRGEVASAENVQEGCLAAGTCKTREGGGELTEGETRERGAERWTNLDGNKSNESQLGLEGEVESERRLTVSQYYQLALYL